MTTNERTSAETHARELRAFIRLRKILGADLRGFLIKLQHDHDGANPGLKFRVIDYPLDGLERRAHEWLARNASSDQQGA